MARGKPMARGAGMKRKARKARPGHDRAMLNACRGQDCYLRISGVCRGETDTVVPAHRNEGKGMGLKTPDVLTVPGCLRCHTWYDTGPAPREQKRAAWDSAYARWSQYRGQPDTDHADPT